MRSLVRLSLFTALLAPPAFAREHVPDRVAVAVGVLATPDYEGSDNFVVTPSAGALIRIAGRSITLRGTSLSVDLVPEYVDQKFKVVTGPLVNLNFDRTGSPRDPVVALTRKRKVAVEGGAFVGFVKTGVLTSAYDSLSVTLSASRDLGTVHHSFVITPSVDYMMPVSRGAMLGASVSADFVGGRYARYYFGVGPTSSSLSGLPQYQPGAGIKNVTLSLVGALALNGDLDRRGVLVGGVVNYERLLGSFAGSPVVAERGNANQVIATMGVGYRF